MTAAPLRRRPGFTLLEVLLASAIAVMLLGGLYVAFDLVLRQTDSGREAVAQGDLGRALVNRMTIDLAGCLGPMPPKSGGEVGSESSSTPTSSTPTTSTPSTTTTPSTDTSGSTATADPTAAATATPGADIPPSGGVYGTATQLTLFASRVPPGLSNRETVAAGLAVQPGDGQRVTYYLSPGGRGLCRQVRALVTADGVRNSYDPDSGAEDADLLAPEVTGLQFEYFDGSTWISDWDGSQANTDGKTVRGPPRAVRVTITLEVAGKSKQIQHVFPLRAAVGLYSPPVEESTTPATEGM